MTWQLETVRSPIGALLLMHDGEALAGLDLDADEGRMRRLSDRWWGGAPLLRTKTISPFGEAVSRYFEGDAAAIDGLKTHVFGTQFQAKCWAALRRIPAGETRSYAQQAAAIGNSKAMRAVGLANGANPIGIVVPCHRVIGANGSLTGYGGGLPRKEWLLKHEAAWAAKRFTLKAG
jgi:methylated-DNA-[protein]-cysteine S-methyltransferase